MHKKFFACLAFLMIMLVSTYGAAQTLNIHKEFAPWERKGSEGDLDQACGSLAISGGTGWLVYEITESPYKKGSLHRATGQYMGSGLFVDFSPYYYPDIILKDEFWPQNTTEPEVAVDGQPRRWHMKVKIGRNLKPFNLKVCWSAPGVRIGGGDYFHQFGQTVDISVTWTPDGSKSSVVGGQSEPASIITGTWDGPWKNTRGESGGSGPIRLKEEAGGIVTGNCDGAEVLEGRRTANGATWKTETSGRKYVWTFTVSSDGKSGVLKYDVIDALRTPRTYSGTQTVTKK